MRRSRHGFSLTEILMALALLSLVTVSALLVLHWALRGGISQQLRSQAACEAAFVTEELWAKTTLPESTQGQRGEWNWVATTKPLDGVVELTVQISKGGESLSTLRSQRRRSRPEVVYRSQPQSGQAQTLRQSPDFRHSSIEKESPIIAMDRAMQEACLSPDGSQVAFVSTEPGIFVGSVKTGTSQRLSEGSDTSPDWAPNGKDLAFIRDGSSLILWRAGREEKLAENPNGWLACPSFGPDGQSLVLMSNESGNPDIFLLDLKSRRKTQLTKDSGYDTEPRLSPDGTQVVFVSNRLGHEAVFVMNLDGSGQRPLAGDGSDPSRSNHQPRWK